MQQWLIRAYRIVVSGSWETMSGSLIQYQRTASHPHCPSPQWVFTDWMWMWVGWFGEGGGIILAVKSGVPAALSGTQRHHKDSVDNEQPLCCVLQGLVKAKPHRHSEIGINCYCPLCLLFHFHCCLIRFHTFLHIILNLILIMEIRDCFDQGSIFFSHI